MELCDECKGRNLRGWDSSVALDEEKERTCSKCGSWFEHPHFLLDVLHGQLREPDPHSFEMDPSLWSNLPLECLHAILAGLPLGSRVRFSIVCKTWQALLGSSDFKRLCDSAEPHELPVCNLKYKPGKLVPCKPCVQRASETEELKDVKVGLSFLPSKFQGLHFQEYVAHDGLVCIFKVDRQKTEKPKVASQRVQMSPSRSDGTGVGDGDGDEDDEDVEEGGKQRDWEGDDHEENDERDEEGYFIADDEDEDYYDEEDEDYYDEEDDDFNLYGPVTGSRENVIGMSFCVANPIMRTFKELPQEFGKEVEYHDPRSRLRVHLEVDASGGHFSVVVFCMRNYEPTVTIYRSKDNSWEVMALTLPFWFIGRYDDRDPWPQYVLCNGELCTAEIDSYMQIHRRRDLDDESFHEEEKPEPRNICKVFAWRGKIYCLDQGFGRQKVDVGIWELERSPYTWREVSFLPEHLQEMLMKPMTLETLKIKEQFNMTERMVALDGATLLGDTLYFTIDTGVDMFCRCADLLGYNILDSTWSLICEALGTPLWSKVSYLFRPNDFVV